MKNNQLQIEQKSTQDKQARARKTANGKQDKTNIIFFPNFFFLFVQFAFVSVVVVVCCSLFRSSLAFYYLWVCGAAPNAIRPRMSRIIYVSLTLHCLFFGIIFLLASFRCLSCVLCSCLQTRFFVVVVRFATLWPVLTAHYSFRA